MTYLHEQSFLKSVSETTIQAVFNYSNPIEWLAVMIHLNDYALVGFKAHRFFGFLEK